MAKVIVMYNQKGGTAKTSSAINIASILSQDLGKKVLVIDNDSQGSATFILTERKDDSFENQPTIFELMTDNNCEVEDVIIKTKYNNLNIIPATIDHSFTQSRIANVSDNSRILSRKIYDIKNDYDYIIIDCGPTIDLCSFNALMASDLIATPIEPNQFSFKGLYNLTQVMEDIKKYRVGENIKSAIFLTKIDNRSKKNNEEIRDQLSSTYEEGFMNNYISFLSVYNKSIDYCEPVNNLEPGGKAHIEYLAITNEIIDRLQ